MATLPLKNPKISKREDILFAAKKLFLENGYDNTNVRQIVQEANTSMGNLYFHFTNKQNILKVISKEYISILHNQIYKIHELGFSPEIGFAIDFRIGFITTMEDPKLSQLWCIVQNTPEIHKYSFENKKIRLQTFFGDRINEEELEFLAIAIQGIADAMFQKKRNEQVIENPATLSNTIIDYSLRLLGYSYKKIQTAICEAERFIKEERIIRDDYFNF